MLAGAGQDTIEPIAYFPGTLRVRAGDTVTWKINSEETHTVTFSGGATPPDPTTQSPFLTPGELMPLRVVPVPDRPGLTMTNPLHLFPTRAPGAPVETYSGRGFVSSGQLDRKPVAPGVASLTTFSVVFDTPGAYRNFCLIHSTNMAGTVEVLPASSTNVPDQRQIETQAQSEMATLLAQTEAAHAQGDTPRGSPGPNDTTLWSVRVGNHAAADPRVELFEYLPKNLTVQAGDTVVWDSLEVHTVNFAPTTPAPEWLQLEMHPDGSIWEVLNPELATPSKPSGVYDPQKLFNSGRIGSVRPDGTTWALTFEEPGTFEYSCFLHRELGMTGTVTVVGRS